jgi:iron complex transport system ATP-binding protein
MTNEMPTLTLDRVEFAVGNRTILKPLTVQFSGRGVTGLVGQNGSGKSTLLKLLARQQRPTTGRIGFAGRPIEGWGDREFARKLAYLPQQTAPAAGLLVRELVAMGRYPWHGALGRFGAADQAAVDEALALTDTDVLADRFVETLSGGEVQRVWFAMLVAQRANLLLLDEPISALDVAHQVAVLRLIRRLSEERGVGVLIVIHEINMAARFCDEILALKNGELIAHGTPAELMTTQQLESIYDVGMGTISHPDSGGQIAYVRF